MLARKIVILLNFKNETQSIISLNFFKTIKIFEYIHSSIFFIRRITLSQQIQNYFSTIFLKSLHLFKTFLKFDDQV